MCKDIGLLSPQLFLFFDVVASVTHNALFADTITVDDMLLARDPLESRRPSFGLKYQRMDIPVVTKSVDHTINEHVYM